MFNNSKSTRPAATKEPVADQQSADQTAADAKEAEKNGDPTTNLKDGRSLRTGTPTGPKPNSINAGDNNPQDGTPIVQPTNDLTRPDATKGPLHNPGVVVEAGRADPSPSTVVPDDMLLKRDPTDPSRVH